MQAANFLFTYPTHHQKSGTGGIGTAHNNGSEAGTGDGRSEGNVNFAIRPRRQIDGTIIGLAEVDAGRADVTNRDVCRAHVGKRCRLWLAAHSDCLQAKIDLCPGDGNRTRGPRWLNYVSARLDRCRIDEENYAQRLN